MIIIIIIIMITGITHERYWQTGKWLHWSVKYCISFSCGTLWENSCLLQKRNAVPCGAFMWRWQFGGGMDE